MASHSDSSLPWIRAVTAPAAAFTSLWVAYALANHGRGWPWHAGVFGVAVVSCGVCLVALQGSQRELPSDARAARFVHATATALAWYSLLVIVAFAIAFVMVEP